MKHIWWINHHAVPPIVPGGTRHYSLAKEIMKLGDYKVTVINGSFDHLTPHFEEGAEWGAMLSAPIIRSYDGVDFYSLPTPYYKGNASLGRLNNMRAFYKNAMNYLSPHSLTIIDKPDIIIGSTVHPLAAYAGYKLSQLYHIPFVYEVRDLWPLTLVEIGKISKYNPIALVFGYLDKKMAKAARLIITTAPLMKNYYIENYKIDESKFLWITNGSSFTNQEVEIDISVTNTVIHVGYAGSIGLANGIDSFLRTLRTLDTKLLEKFHFTFIGNGPQKSKFVDYCLKEKLPVTFQDAVPKKHIVDKLGQFDMLLVIILPSSIYKYGISSNKLADYHAIGKPILMIGNVAMNPVTEADSGFLCEDMDDLESILKTITNCSANTLLAKASNARKFAEEYYSWERLAQKLNQKIKYIEENQ